MSVVQTRRVFLVRSSSVAAGAAVTPTVLWGKSFHAKRRATWLGEITQSDFIQALHTTFKVQIDGETAARLTLVNVTDRATPLAQSHLPDARNEKFTLLLNGPPALRLSQDTYHFEHPGLGEFDMFITPLFSTNPESNQYEAIFNRARSQSVSAW